MTKIINGRELAEKIKDKTAREIYELKGPRPNLAIILVGERQDSVLYVNLKEKEAKKVGIDTHLYKCPANIPEREVFDMIKHLNEDNEIDAILVQLPLPDGFDTDGIIRAIDPQKDVDCFHPDNLKILFKSCDHDNIIPPVVRVILEMLKSINYDLKEKRACVLCNSDIFGKSMAHVLSCHGAKTEIVHINEKKFTDKTKKADVLITALGEPHFIKKEMIKKGAVVIDIGTVKEGEKISGDVDFENVDGIPSYITPVPGGVGPMTIALLFVNCLEIYKRRRS